jgi:hypothetical protein
MAALSVHGFWAASEPSKPAGDGPKSAPYPPNTGHCRRPDCDQTKPTTESDVVWFGLYGKPNRFRSKGSGVFKGFLDRE